MSNTIKERDLTAQEILQINQETFERFYKEKWLFLRYPADWVIRFHNIYLKKYIPSGRVLDFGFGTGNNSILFLDKGYEVHGLEIVPSSLDLVKENLKKYNFDLRLMENFKLLDLNWEHFPFKDGFLDAIIANQVVYYYPTKEHIQKVSREFARCLRPGGVVFITMMSPKNNFLQDYIRSRQGKIVDADVKDPNDRLYGSREIIYVIDQKEELTELFPDFECLNIGSFETSLFDLTSTHHWIFVGKKKEA